MYKYAVAHSLLIFTSVSVVLASERFHARQNGGGGGGVAVGAPPVTTPATTPATPPTTTPQGPITTPPITTPTTTPTTQVTTPPTTGPTGPTTQPITTPTTTPTSTSATSTSDTSQTSLPSTTSTTPDLTSLSTSIDPQGSTIVQIVTTTSPADSANESASPTPTSAPEDNSVKPGTIIGLSVAGGIAALAIIAFIIWKLTRKRFGDLDDPDEAIKWPELNRDTHLGAEDLSRQRSNPYSTTPSRNASTLDQSDLADPYAVPPLPQFNPNQPYRDDPGAYGGGGGYYDPYRGPVPQTLHDGSLDGHESIPMSTYPTGARSRSPGPGAAYDVGGRGSPAPGRGSPGPGVAYDMGGRGSPVHGRTISPGPAAALGLDRRPSPAPQYAMGGQPEMVAKSKSPGPNVLG